MVCSSILVFPLKVYGKWHVAHIILLIWQKFSLTIHVLDNVSSILRTYFLRAKMHVRGQ